MKKIFGIAFGFTVLTVILMTAINIYAQTAGSLDTSFGTNGVLATRINGTAQLKDLVVQPDGKTVFVGTTFAQGQTVQGAFVARLNQNGTFDTTFDTDGFRNDRFLEDATAVALQPDGKIIVVGYTFVLGSAGVGMARFNPNGSLDATFDGDGIAGTRIGSDARATSVLVQPDGKILVGGLTALTSNFVNRDFAIVKYNENGSLDGDFGTQGWITTEFNGGTDAIYDLALQADGKIVAAGLSTDLSTNIKRVAIARYYNYGLPDSTFGDGGKVVRQSEINSENGKVAIQPDSKILVYGNGFPMIRFNLNGTFDAAFDTGNTYTVAVKFVSGGKIVAVGGNSGGSESGFVITRYNSSGSRDRTFGTNGQIATTFVPNAFFTVAAFTPDGKVVGGGIRINGGFEIVLARYFGDNSTIRTAMDFDGDGKADVAVFRPSTGVWYIQQSSNGSFYGVPFGISTDKLVPADYDGDGKTDIAVYRDGVWYLNRSTGGFFGIQFGAAEDIPAPADFNGDGKAEIAVFRPSNGVWYLYDTAANQASGFTFGMNGDRPVPADYDGDGKADIAVFRPTDGKWYVQGSFAGFIATTQFGSAVAKQIPADYDGDGKADYAIKVPDGDWLIRRSSLGSYYLNFGLESDIPVPADYDGDGKTDIAVYRNGVWYQNRSTQGVVSVTFGAATDLPVQSAFVR